MNYREAFQLNCSMDTHGVDALTAPRQPVSTKQIDSFYNIAVGLLHIACDLKIVIKPSRTVCVKLNGNSEGVIGVATEDSQLYLALCDRVLSSQATILSNQCSPTDFLPDPTCVKLNDSSSGIGIIADEDQERY